MGSTKNEDPPVARKPLRRRSHTRKATRGLVINMAEARREIALALQLHRSSSSSSSSSSASSACSEDHDSKRNPNPALLGNNDIITSCHNSYYKIEKPFVANICATSNYSGHNYYHQSCHSFMDALPTPEPVWSTTAPSVLATPTGMTTGGLEFDQCGSENYHSSASYSWWLEFLRTSDSNVTTTGDLPVPKHCASCVGEIINVAARNPRMFDHHHHHMISVKIVRMSPCLELEIHTQLTTKAHMEMNGCRFHPMKIIKVIDPRDFPLAKI